MEYPKPNQLLNRALSHDVINIPGDGGVESGYSNLRDTVRGIKYDKKEANENLLAKLNMEGCLWK